MNLTLDDMREILEVYGEVPKAPKGYEFTGERRYPQAAEWWLGDTLIPLYNSYPYRRLILRKLPEPPKVMEFTISTKDVYPGGYVIPEGYESLGFGLEHPKASDYLEASTGIMFPFGYKARTDVRILLKKKE